MTTTSKRHPAWSVLLPLAVITTIALAASACSDDGDTATSDPTEQSATDQATDDGSVTSTDDEGTTPVDGGLLAAELAALPTTTLSDADRDALIFMREEEKLALDVYQELHNVWELRIFDNISAAEQTHTDSVKTLLDRFDIPDPALDQPAGIFQNADLQTFTTTSSPRAANR